MPRIVSSNPAESFLRGAGLTQGLINNHRLSEMREREFQRAETRFENEMDDREAMQLANFAVANFTDPATGALDIESLNAWAADPEIKAGLDAFATDWTGGRNVSFAGFVPNQGDPSGDSVIPAIQNEAGQLEPLAEGDSDDARVAVTASANAPRIVLAAIAQHNPTAFNAIRAAAREAAQAGDLREFFRADIGDPASAPAAPAAAQVAPRAGLGAAQPAAPSVSPPAPAAPAAPASLPRGLGPGPLPEPKPASGILRQPKRLPDSPEPARAPAPELSAFEVGQRAREGVGAATNAAVELHPGLRLSRAVVRAAPKIMDGARDFAAGLFGADAPPKPAPKKAPKKTPAAATPKPSAKPETTKTADKLSTPPAPRSPTVAPPRSINEGAARVKQRFDGAAAKRNGLTEKQIDAISTRLGRMVAQRTLTMEQAQSEIRRVTGRPAEVMSTGGHLLFFGENKDLIAMQELPMSAAERGRLAQDALVAHMTLARQDRVVAAANAKEERQRQRDAIAAGKAIATNIAGTGSKQNRSLFKWLSGQIPALIDDMRITPNSMHLQSIVDSLVALVEDERDGFAFFSDRPYSEFNLTDVARAAGILQEGESLGDAMDNLTPTPEALAAAAARGVQPFQVNDAISILAQRMANEEKIDVEKAAAIVKSHYQRAPSDFLTRFVVGGQ